MKMPNLSNMMRIGQLRHIQSVCETMEYKNPDNLATVFLSPAQRWSCLWRSMLQLSRFRADPFYSYLIARTKYYDQLFTGAVQDNVRVIINIGCGSDTRAYRFSRVLKQHGVRVLECDQPEAIQNKQGVARKNWSVDHVTYVSLDLNRLWWDELDLWLRGHGNGRIFVLMEGVSPYIGRVAFGKFLSFIASRLPPGSRLAYDFKIQGIADRFGYSDGVGPLFRLGNNLDEAEAYHRSHGLRLDRLETSAALTLRLLPRMAERRGKVFHEDCLVQLTALGKDETQS